MIKSIIREIIIILLLLLAIVLALGVLFYEYIPTNKTVPSVATYSTSKNIQTELDEKITEDETVLVTYEITSSDLNTYEKTNEYTKGKVNPFSTYETQTPDVDETNNNASTNTDSISTNTQTTNTKSNTFYNSTGTK